MPIFEHDDEMTQEEMERQQRILDEKIARMNIKTSDESVSETEIRGELEKADREIAKEMRERNRAIESLMFNFRNETFGDFDNRDEEDDDLAAC